jgi:hypothetical protein
MSTSSNAPIYVLLDSTYRDRTQYPNPASFSVPFSTIQSQTVRDPVLLGVPTNTGVSTSAIIAGVSTTVNIGANPAPWDNFYVQGIIQFGTEFRKIKSYTFSTTTISVVAPFDYAYGAGRFVINCRLIVESLLLMAPR